MEKQTSTQKHRPIHYVVWRSGYGGAELSIKHYVDQFGAQRPLFLYSLRDSDNQVCDNTKINFTRGSDKGWKCYSRYFQYCRKHRGASFHLMSTGPIILLISLLAGVRNPLYHIHGTIYWKKAFKKVYLKTAWWLSNLFQIHFVANSKYSASIFNREVLPVQPKVIYNGFNVHQFWSHRTQRKQIRRIAYAGRLQPGKNTELVLRLFEEVAGQMPDLELHFAGDGALRPALEKQAAESPFHNRIVFHGWVEDIAAFYGSMDLFLFLSAYESFGNVLSEALLTGLPILTSSIPVFEEIHGGEAAFLLGNPNEYDEVKNKFIQAISQYPKLAEKAFAISERVRTTFNIDQHLAEIENIYAQIESTGNILPFRSAKAV